MINTNDYNNLGENEVASRTQQEVVYKISALYPCTLGSRCSPFLHNIQYKNGDENM